MSSKTKLLRMPPVTSASVTLICPLASGHGNQFVMVPLNDFDANHNPVTNPTLSASVSGAGASAVETVVNPSGSNPLEVKIRTKTPRPANASTATVTITDGRTRSDGTAVPPVVITVQLVDHPDASSLEIPSDSLPLVAMDEADAT